MELNFTKIFIFLTWILLHHHLSAAVVNVKPETMLSTQTKRDASITYGNYYYGESIGIKIEAFKTGVEFSNTLAVRDYFYKFDIRLANGEGTYTGSGVLNNTPDYYVDAKFLVGKDYRLSSGNYVVSPFVGMGYRYLYNDSRGISSTGAAGYRRESSYYYLPMGLTGRGYFAKGILETTFSLDYLASGKQTSYLSDAIGRNGITYIPDAKNLQTSGFGVGLSVMYKYKNLSFGPYYHEWRIDDSERYYGSAVINGVTYNGWAYEPSNKTIERGFRLKYSF